MARPELSLVIPIYNEEDVLPTLDSRLKNMLGRLGLDAEVVFVDDGSRDRSLAMLRDFASRDLRYRVIALSRNFGHQRAISAGMDKSRGRAVVVMDADLQDPPEVVLEMVARWREGYDVVYGRRRSRQGESFFKLLTAKLFYRFFRAMIPIEVPLDTGDFRLMSRRVVNTMRNLRETHRFVRGLVAWVGFRQTAVEYDRSARFAGETKYPLRKMIAFALDGIASFSIQPLRFATYVGALVATASVLYAFVAVGSYLSGHTVPGWTTTVVLVAFLFSVQFVMIGVLGEYVGRIYEQVKRRPLYVVADRINFDVKRPRAPKNHSAESTQEVAPILTTDKDVFVGVPEKPSLRVPPPQDPTHFPKPAVHTLFGHPAPSTPPQQHHAPAPQHHPTPPPPQQHTPPPQQHYTPPPMPAAPPPVPAAHTVATVHGLPARPPADVTENDLVPMRPLELVPEGAGGTAEIPLIAVKAALEDLVSDDSQPFERSALGALALLERASRTYPPPGKAPSTPPGDVPPPPAALTAALADSEAAARDRASAAPSRPPPARKPSMAEMPPPDAPKPLPLDLSASIGGIAVAPPLPEIEPATSLPPVVDTRSGRPPGAKTGKPPNVTARLAALSGAPAKPREPEPVPDTAKSATDDAVKPKARDES